MFVISALAVLIVSLVSLVGIFTLSLGADRLRRILFMLISLSVGALLGDVFLHILPEIFESGEGAELMPFVFVGFIIFFVLEKFLRWHHGHEGEIHDSYQELDPGHGARHLGYINIFSDGLHNFIDGLVIGGSFLVSFEIGIATTIAVVLHEIPQEIGDFGLLLHAGFSRAQALVANFFSAAVAFAGLGLAFVLGSGAQGMEILILPLAAGGFIYVAAADLVPELHKANDLSKSLLQFAAILAGFLLMFGLLFLEDLQLF